MAKFVSWARIAGLALLLAWTAISSASAADKPLNVVVFLIDDMGWMDLGCQGSDYYRTPNIDRLAAEGMRFTDAYAACAVCSPTRAALMTGKNPARLLLTQWLPSGRWDAAKNKLREARYLRALPLEEVTIAEALREAGYHTGFVGKWHLGGPPFYLPEHQGFDVNIAGNEHGNPGNYFFPYNGSWKIPTTDLRAEWNVLADGKPGEYLPDRLAEESAQFIRKAAEKPFFLLLSHYAVHTPLQAKKDVQAKYEKVPKDQQQGKPAYAAMVESVDDSVGKIMATLQELKLADNTLIVFTSDNGGFARATSNAPLRGNKGCQFEGGLRVPLIVKWPGVVKAGSTSDQLAITHDIYPTILEAAGLPARPQQTRDGISLVSALKGMKTDRALHWHYPHYNQHPFAEPAGVIRDGNWKLIEYFETGKTELYNLKSDLSETNDLAEQEPAHAKRLLNELRTWRQEVGADPMRPNPEYRGK